MSKCNIDYDVGGTYIIMKHLKKYLTDDLKW